MPNRQQYNDKEVQDALDLGWVDYGARMYQPELGRWIKVDKKAELYTNMSPYCYAANTPINAIDPDGNLVIFISGFSMGDGGTRDYWQQKEWQKKYVAYQDGFGNNLFGFYERHKETTVDFAESFCKTFGEDVNRAKFYDGAPLDLPFSSFRRMVGNNKGKREVEEIIKSLHRTDGVITEPLLLATHSMGGAYGRGFLKAITDYVKENPTECIGLSISVYDFDPYQATFLEKVYGITIQQVFHDGTLAEQKEKEVSADDGSFVDDTHNSDSHAIVSFIESFNRLEPGAYVWKWFRFCEEVKCNQMKYFCVLMLLSFYICGCKNELAIKRQFSTKPEFRCTVRMNSPEYLADSLSFVRKCESYVHSKKSPYGGPAYNDLTVVYVDTILYNSNLTHAAVFVISKCHSNTSNQWSYDGVVHFASRIEDPLRGELNWKIHSNHGARHILAESYEKMSEILRMNNLVYRSYEASQKRIVAYNIDDCRFWTSDSFIKKMQPGGFVELPD